MQKSRQRYGKMRGNCICVSVDSSLLTTVTMFNLSLPNSLSRDMVPSLCKRIAVPMNLTFVPGWEKIWFMQFRGYSHMDITRRILPGGYSREDNPGRINLGGYSQQDIPGRLIPGGYSREDIPGRIFPGGYSRENIQNTFGNNTKNPRIIGTVK